MKKSFMQDYTAPVCEVHRITQENNFLATGDPDYTIPDVEEEDLEWED